MSDTILVQITEALSPVAVSVTEESTSVTVDISEARDAYQLWLADGHTGTRADYQAWLKGQDGEPVDMEAAFRAAPPVESTVIPGEGLSPETKALFLPIVSPDPEKPGLFRVSIEDLTTFSTLVGQAYFAPINAQWQYGDLLGLPTLGTAAAQPVEAFAPSGTISFPGFGTSHAVAAYGDHNHDTAYASLTHTHTFSSLSGKPTTLAGYGITDAAPSSTVSFPGFGTSHVTAAYGDHNHNSASILYLNTQQSLTQGTNKLTLGAGTYFTSISYGNASTTTHTFVAGNVTMPGTLGVTGATTVTGLLTANGNIAGTEVTAPDNPAAGKYVIYAEDNGAGKTRLMVKFQTGAAQQLAIEP